MMFSTKPNEDEEMTTISPSHNLSESNPSRILNQSASASAPSYTPALPYQDCCKLEPEELYVDHHFMEEVVIGLPTTIKDEGVDHKITAPSINSNQNVDEVLHTTNDPKLHLQCKVEIPDVRDTLYCYHCGQWSLTEGGLLRHKIHHSQSSIDAEQNLENVEVSNQHLNPHDNESWQVNQIDKKMKVTITRKAKTIKQNGKGERKKIKRGRNERGSYSSDKMFPCDLCEKSFSKKYTLNIHKFEHRIKPFSCEMCGSSFDNERACAIHVLTCIQPNDTSETLQIKREEEAQADSSEHFDCDVDERIFEQFQAENQQLDYLRNNEESQKVNQHDETIAIIFPCKEEPQEENQNDNNMFHYNGDESVFQQFEEENQQIRYYPHDDVFQEEHQRFVCDYCRKDFSNKITLLRHIQNKCCTDSKSRNGKDKLKKRKKALKEQKSNEMFSCDLCNKFLTSKNSLKVHKHRHHLHRVKVFTCEICSFSFENELACAIHKLKHATENVEKHSCEVCDRILGSRKELDKHKKSHAKNTLRFICDYCGKDFSRKCNLITHMRNICKNVPKSISRKDKRKKRNIGERGFPCNLCNKSFTRQWGLDVHKRTHGRKPFSCEICGQMFHNEKDCKIHELIHAGIKAYQCNLCEKSFGYKYGLISHMDFHSGGKQYSCDTCKRRFKYEGNLKAHNRMFHNPSKQPHNLICDKCGKTFTCKRYIIKHIATHDEEGRFACEQCPKRFSLKWHLNQHFRSKHTVGGLFECEQCGQQLTTKNSLESHKRRHDGTLEKYPCDVCGKTFYSKSYLVVHKLRHQGIRNKQFSCETCGKGFEESYSLKRHKIIHSDARPHSCDICGKSFKLKQGVSLHKIQMHTNDRPFVCDICGSRHKTIGDRTNHMKLHDDNEHWCDHCGKQFTSKTSVARHIFGYCVKSGQKRIAKKYSIKGYKRPARIKPFSCEICGYSFTTERARANHELKHETDKVEKHSNCNVCGRVHKSREELDKHKKSHAKNSQRYICELCGTHFSRKSKLITHIENRCGTVPKSIKRKEKRKKRKIGKRGFPCHLCYKSFTRQWCLDVHKHIHERKPFSCEICGQMFDNEKACENHELLIHAGIKPHQCNQCEKAFDCKSGLKIHSDKHRAEKSYCCDSCNRRFKYNGNLVAHNRMFHNPSKLPQKFTCDKCGKTFTCKSYIIKHIATHDEDRRLTCEQCPKSFFRKCDLKAHVLSKHTVRGLFECDQCGQQLTSKYSLESHKRHHDKTQKKYPCDVCGKTFYSKSYLVVHKLRHQGIRNKQFSCETCGKGFEESYSLKRHKVIHSDERPHSCDICGLSFKLKQSLSYHQLSHTNVRPFACEICGRRYSTFGKRTQHMKVHDDDKRNEHWCDYCGKQFAYKKSVARHIFGYCKNSGQKKIAKKFGKKRFV